MRRRYRGPILWIGLGVIVILAYVLSQPVPISTEGYRPPEVAQTATDAAAAANVAAAVTPPAAEPVPVIETPAPLAVAPEPAAIPVPAPAVTAPAAPQGEAMYVSATSLNLRAAPEPGGAVLEVLPRGTRVEAVGQRDGWREVLNPATGTRGWMSSEFLTTTAPAAAPTATPAPAATPGPTPNAPAATPAPGLILLPG